ncbi:hypothetical protein [Mycobacterium gastri]|uniref:Uncharacterized protein n=1 Tax=Mycobacterium gastri TaxID=1777 RepID=A0A1X1VKU1_MYCGS|nr:hypothetical protein [Mycobacterium gastri]ORV69676.1 hypothetical protein AWC07_06400 [Mycobacterium gastri]
MHAGHLDPDLAFPGADRALISATTAGSFDVFMPPGSGVRPATEPNFRVITIVADTPILSR